MPKIDVLQPTERVAMLSTQDRTFYHKGVGLIRNAPVDPRCYDAHYFSEAHVAYTEGYTLEGRLEKYRDAIENIARSLGEPIVDFGCGPGFIVEGLRRMGIDVQGVDISQEAIEVLSPEPARRLLHRSTLTDLPFDDGQFESGYSFHVLEHLTEEELDRAVAEISRVVQRKLYLIIPTWDSLQSPELFNQIISDPTHRIIVNRDWWIEKFAQFGWNHDDVVAAEMDRIDRGWVFFFNRED